MATRAVWVAAALLLVAGCTEAGGPDAAGTQEPTEVSSPGATDGATGGEGASPQDTGGPGDAVSPPPTTTDSPTAGGGTGDGPAGPASSECEAAVAAAGGLDDLRDAEQRLRPVFDRCGSVEEFTAAVESELEGFEDVDLQPYVRSACTLVEELSGTRLCQST